MNFLATLLFMLIVGFSSCQANTISTLKETLKDDFLIGTALNESQFYEINIHDIDIIKGQFNSIIPENILKWESVHPSPNEYAFETFDVIVSVADLAEYTDLEGINKPKPYIYLQTAKLLGLHPEQCAAIEDSRTGISSAVNAGCISVAVRNAYTPNKICLMHT